MVPSQINDGPFIKAAPTVFTDNYPSVDMNHQMLGPDGLEVTQSQLHYFIDKKTEAKRQKKFAPGHNANKRPS